MSSRVISALRDIKWWQVFVTVSLMLILITALDDYTPSFSQKWRLISPFDLGLERNVATWWSGLMLFLCAVLAYERVETAPATVRFSWMFLSFLLLGLACDEIGSLHERIIPWVQYSLAVFLACIMAYSLFRFFRFEQTRVLVLPIAVAFGLYGSVIVQEHFGTTIWPGRLAGMHHAIEEGTELAGTFILMFALVNSRDRRLVKPGLLAALPDPLRLKNIQWFFWIGVTLHWIAMMLIGSELEDAFRGDPGLLFPAFAFFLVSIAGLWASRSAERDRWVWLTFAVICLISSIEMVAGLSNLVPLKSRLPFALGQVLYIGFMGLQTLLLTLIIRRGEGPQSQLATGFSLLWSAALVAAAFALGGDVAGAARGVWPFIVGMLLIVYYGNSASMKARIA